MNRSVRFPILVVVALPIMIFFMFVFPVEEGLHPAVIVNFVWIACVLITQQIYHRRMWHKCKHCGHNRYMHDPNELVDFPSLIKIVCREFERSHVEVKPNYYDLSWKDEK